MLQDLPDSLQRLTLDWNPCSISRNFPALELEHLTSLTELVLQGTGCRLRYDCSLPVSLQRLVLPGGSFAPPLHLTDLKSLSITSCEWQGHRELAALGTSLSKLTHFSLDATKFADTTWLGVYPQRTVAALQALPLQSLAQAVQRRVCQAFQSPLLPRSCWEV
jgi:hypothetical protein